MWPDAVQSAPPRVGNAGKAWGCHTVLTHTFRLYYPNFSMPGSTVSDPQKFAMAEVRGDGYSDPEFLTDKLRIRRHPVEKPLLFLDD